MTRDDIEAFFKSINFSTDDEDSFQIFWDFAKVVAAAEREACAVIAFNAKTYIEAAKAIRARSK